MILKFNQFFNLKNISVSVSHVQFVLLTQILDLTNCLVQVINYIKKYKYLL